VRTEDGYIINKCLNGEPEAFGSLVDKNTRKMFMLLLMSNYANSMMQKMLHRKFLSKPPKNSIH